MYLLPHHDYNAAQYCVLSMTIQVLTGFKQRPLQLSLCIFSSRLFVFELALKLFIFLALLVLTLVCHLWELLLLLLNPPAQLPTPSGRSLIPSLVNTQNIKGLLWRPLEELPPVVGRYW